MRALKYSVVRKRVGSRNMKMYPEPSQQCSTIPLRVRQQRSPDPEQTAHQRCQCQQSRRGNHYYSSNDQPVISVLRQLLNKKNHYTLLVTFKKVMPYLFAQCLNQFHNKLHYFLTSRQKRATVLVVGKLSQNIIIYLIKIIYLLETCIIKCLFRDHQIIIIIKLHFFTKIQHNIRGCLNHLVRT